jgi:iron complex transport system substrate-binding protein
VGRVRIASLLPSATEIVYALGAQADLVAVTHECDEPPTARADHRVVVAAAGGGTDGLAPAEIDRRVAAAVAADDPLYTLDVAAFAELRPDVILTQDLCRVCAVPAGQVDAALDRLGCAADVVTLDPARLSDVLGTIATVGRAIGREQRAAELTAELRARLDAVAARVAGRARPRVAVLEWTDPLFSAGHWVPDLVRAAGGTPVALPPGRRSERLPWPDLYAAEPDVVVVAPCGYHLPGAAEQAAAILPMLVPGQPVFAMDADGLVVRPGPRVVAGVEALSRVLHPAVWDDDPDPGAIIRVSRS